MKVVQILWQDTAKKPLIEMEKPNLPALEVAVKVAATVSSPPQKKNRTRKNHPEVS